MRRIPVPTPFPVGDVNAYLILDDPLTLVDSGPRVEGAWEALVEGIRSAGRDPRDVRRLVLTHPHQDHAGLARQVREASGCAVFAHPCDHARLLGRAGEWERIVAFLAETCRRAGAPAAIVEAVRAELEGAGAYAEPLDRVDALNEGDALHFERGSLEVLHTPGHARGALCLRERSEGLLFSGDTLIPHISSNAVLEPDEGRFRRETLLEYTASLRRLLELGPSSVLPGHGEVLVGTEAVRRLLSERLLFHERRAERIRWLVEAGLRTPWEIGERLFSGLDAHFGFLAVSEVVGHLDLLAGRGEISFQGQQAPWSASPRSTSSCPP